MYKNEIQARDFFKANFRKVLAVGEVAKQLGVDNVNQLVWALKTRHGFKFDVTKNGRSVGISRCASSAAGVATVKAWSFPEVDLMQMKTEVKAAVAKTAKTAKKSGKAKKAAPVAAEVAPEPEVEVSDELGEIVTA